MTPSRAYADADSRAEGTGSTGGTASGRNETSRAASSAAKQATDNAGEDSSGMAEQQGRAPPRRRKAERELAVLDQHFQTQPPELTPPTKLQTRPEYQRYRQPGAHLTPRMPKQERELATAEPRRWVTA
ncbi:hypothetical protein PF003_g7553 [Phytophthora fragariae]|nr:hypothetical protein PF003_g7553 [Phytophthora fragariae]